MIKFNKNYILCKELNERNVEMTYNDAISYKEFDTAIENYIEVNHPDEHYGGGKTGILGKYGHGLNNNNIIKILKFAKKSNDKELIKLVDNWKNHDKEIKIKY